MGKRREKFDNLVKSLSTKQKIFIGAIVLLAVIAICYQIGWTGFGEDSNVSEMTKPVINPKDGKPVINPKDGKPFTFIEITKHSQSHKTLWDWLGLAGTLAIPVVLFLFEHREQRRADKQAEAEKAIAENNLREQALEAYIDRMSELLLDKKMKTLTADDRNTAFEVARARTLSVLRRLNKDGERKGSVVRFLIDAELISELNLNDVSLEGAHLEGAHLKGAPLEGAHLEGAHLESAQIPHAHLKNAHLKGAHLYNAYLFRAYLENAHLEGAHLTHAYLKGANLKGARLEQASLNEETTLPDGSEYQSKDQLTKFTHPDTTA